MSKCSPTFYLGLFYSSVFMVLVMWAALAYSKNQVLMYTMDGCGYCELAKSYLKKKNITFTDCNLKQKYCLDGFKIMGGSGTPLLIINGKRIDGYDTKAINEALEK